MIYVIQLAKEFKSKTIRINLNAPLKATERNDTQGMHQIIDEDRKLVIQATIVRTMKTDKTLKYSLLMDKVIQQLKPRFIPNIRVIKNCIDILIEKEYLKRQPNEADVLCYVT